jgi:hypothetical protein
MMIFHGTETCIWQVTAAGNAVVLAAGSRSKTQKGGCYFVDSSGFSLVEGILSQMACHLRDQSNCDHGPTISQPKEHFQ